MKEQALLVLGKFNYDGLSSLLDRVDNLRLKRSRVNKEKYLDNSLNILSSGQIQGVPLTFVLVGLTEEMIVAASSDEHAEKFKRMFECVGRYEHAILASNWNLSGNIWGLPKTDEPINEKTWPYSWVAQYTCRPWGIRLGYHLTLRAKEFVHGLRNSDLNVVPYRTMSDASLLAQKLVRDALKGTVYEVYVSKEQVLSEEFDRFVSLFCKYMNKVRGMDVGVEREDKVTSVIYRFHSETLAAEDLPSALDEFKDFLVVVEANPDGILTLFEHSGLPESDVARIGQDFKRDWRRLKHDMTFTVKRRLLELEEKYSAAIIDTKESLDLGQLAAGAMNPLSLLPIGNLTVLAQSVEMQLGGNAMRINKVVNNGGQNTFADSITGSVFSLQDDDRELLEVIDRFAPQREKPKLENSVQMLSDPKTPAPDRLSAKAKIEQFIFKNVLPKIGEEGAKFLFGLLEKKLSGN